MVAAARTTNRFASRKILVIDDEHRLAQSLAALLRGVGYDVKAATSGPSGLQAVRETPFDLIITDLRMDAIDGFDIIRHVVEHCSRTALIVITGHASMESAIEALHLHVSDYIPKPFDFDFLCRSVEKVLAQQETQRLKDDLVSMLTHDIKVPLTSILGFAQIIRRESTQPGADVGHHADIIVSNCQKVLAMLDNYLTNARVEEGRLEIMRLPINMADVIEQELALLQLEIRRKDIDVQCEFRPIRNDFRADEHLLARVAGNLLANAVKYTPAGGEIIISLFEEDDLVHFVVENACDALTREDTERIFRRYERAQSSAGVDGTGLGLHVVRCIVEAHKGDIRCSTANGRVLFSVILPLIAPDEV